MSPRGPKKGTKRQTHSDELKDQVIAFLKEGKTVKEASEKFSISPATINFWKKSAGLTGGKRGRRPGSTVKKDGESVSRTPRTPRTSRGSRLQAQQIEGAITLNGEVYVPAKSVAPRNTERLLKILDRIQDELASLKEFAGAAD